MQMVGKKYAEYTEDLYNESLKISTLDSIETRKIISQVEEVAKKTGSIEWKLQVTYFELELFNKNFSLYGNEHFPLEELLNKNFQLLRETEKANLIYLELIVRKKITDYYWYYFKNYELAFEQYKIQEERLQNVSSSDIPEKALYFIEIANAHYFFKDYAKAIIYYNAALEEEDNIRSQFSKQHARNGLGLSYLYGYNNINYSDSCFLSMMDMVFYPENKRMSNIWNAIAQGNLGYNMILREAFDQAIPLLENSLEVMLKDDLAFSTGPAINLAEIYLKKGNIIEAKRYIDLAKDCYNKMPRAGMLSRIYKVLNKYYAAVGNSKLSMAYMDSTVAENRKQEDRFSALQLMRVEQRQHLSEQELKEEQLNTEKIRSYGYQRSLIITLIALISIGGMLAFYFVLYNQKKAAYKELVRKSQEWAHVNEDELKNEVPDEVDFLIMKEIEKIMSEDRIYRDTTLSVDLLAQKIGYKRHNVSMAINHCMNKSFNTFINEYRVKEAIHILSKSNINTFTVDAIAFDVGFGNRRTFYRVFKKMTGLSPTEFRLMTSR